MKANNIIIVGGGSAGWMTATTFVRLFPKKKITLVESPDIKTVGVGESTINQFKQWLSLVKIKDEDFMKYTDASYKFTIRFTNFNKINSGRIEDNKLWYEYVETCGDEYFHCNECGDDCELTTDKPKGEDNGKETNDERS